MEKNKSLTIVTTFNEALWERYANRSIPTWFDRFDKKVEFHFHTDGFEPIVDKRIKYFKDSEIKKKFIEQHQDKSITGAHNNWQGYCHKVFAQIESSRISDNQIMIFLDADVAMLEIFKFEIAVELLKDNFCGCVLRDNQNTETGVIFYNLALPQTSLFLNELENLYLSGDLFSLSGWDDCSAFDTCRKKLNLPVSSLSGEYSWFIDPIAIGPLSKYFDHWISKVSKLRGYSKHRKFRKKLGIID